MMVAVMVMVLLMVVVMVMVVHTENVTKTMSRTILSTECLSAEPHRYPPHSCVQQLHAGVVPVLHQPQVWDCRL